MTFAVEAETYDRFVGLLPDDEHAAEGLLKQPVRPLAEHFPLKARKRIR
jgi:hypothetical protein